MDNSSKRIALLLKLAQEDENQGENMQPLVKHYYEEQPGEPSNPDHQSEEPSDEKAEGIHFIYTVRAFEPNNFMLRKHLYLRKRNLHPGFFRYSQEKAWAIFHNGNSWWWRGEQSKDATFPRGKEIQTFSITITRKKYKSFKNWYSQ